MRRLFALLTVAAALAGACSGNDDEPVAAPTTTIPTSTTAATAEAPSAAPTTYCAGVEQINVSLDEIGRTMLATLGGEQPGAFIVVLGDTVELLSQTAELAPPEAADATTLLATSYAGFQELLLEIDFQVGELPTDDPRATALNSPEFAAAVATMTETCS